MKQQYLKSVLFAALACMPLAATAQEEAAAADTLSGKKVNVAFKTIDQKDLLGGVSVVDVVDLLDKNYITYSLDNMSSLVGGYTGNLWGQGNVLVLVDGVPRAENNVLPSEIDQITFLKGANAIVLYGSRAANGVILITTKRGDNEGLKVSVRGNATFAVPKSYPKYLGAAEYMNLYNEARKNDGQDAAFSYEDIYNTASGQNPYRYPDVNLLSDEYLKKFQTRYDATAEFIGGGKFAQFYTNINFYHVNDIVDFGEAKDNFTNRLSVRGNVDLRLNDWITGWVDANATFYDARGDRSNFWQATSTLRPNRVAPLIPVDYVEEGDVLTNTIVNINNGNLVDGKYFFGGTQADQDNAVAAMYAAGYNQFTSRQFQFDMGVNMDLSGVLEGLSFRSQFAVDYNTSYSTSIENQYAVYAPVWNNYAGKDQISSVEQYREDKRTATQKTSGTAEKQTLMFSGQFDYVRSFDQHNVSATVLAHGYQTTTAGEYHKLSNANLGIQASYNFAKKYYADFSGAISHSAKLAEGNRQKLSPTVSLGWRLSEEDFLADNDIFNNLKVSASYGIVNQDIDIENYYMYNDVYTADGAWWGWSETNGAIRTFMPTLAGNPDLDFIQRKEFSASVEATLLGGLIDLNANYFRTATEGLIVTRGASAYPTYFKVYYPDMNFIPNENYNNQLRQGFDFEVNFNKKVGEVDLTLGVTGMYYTSENTRVEENVVYDNLRLEGAEIDALRGLRCLGFYTAADIEAIAKGEQASSSFSTVKAGDLKYEDVNGDGLIDDKDQVVLGRWSNPFNMGINLTAKWNGFSLFAALSGGFGGMGVKNNSYYWVYGDGKYSEVVRDRWTSEETADQAKYPRLTTATAAGNNFRTSDFWTYKTDRLNIDKVQLTYTLPQSVFGQSFVKGLQVYASGSSLLTISKESDYMEMSVGSTPQTRSYNLGLKLDF